MTVTSLMWSEFVGRIAVGRIAAGKISPARRSSILKADGTQISETVETVELFAKLGREQGPGSDRRRHRGPHRPAGRRNRRHAWPIRPTPVALATRIKVDEPTLSMVVHDQLLAARRQEAAST